ncbi:MAG: class F sortase [Pseudonocardiaceae bacterium]|nr:class F sortase [Pseudonocardiaceae bacterium]
MALTACHSGPELPAKGVVVSPKPAQPRATTTVDTQAAAPVRVRVPAIGVDAPVEPLDLDARGVLPAPGGNHVTGWWRAGPEPGERGPAVIAGHVDSYRGPAVFFRLTELAAGQRILVDREDGTTVAFAVTHLERHAKDAFPTAAVYGDTPGPELRLITCGGEFDSADRRYLDNIIVHAQRA